ncbi:cytochrome C552 [Parasulfuritortus cantonensis]|uniref:Cytochrome C552 n=1 Tax=Parasulfuritortus cantonensis TaxID=2528202 RepID=A0A4R1BIY1_9PROT|nr:multiheme c-type cytochrome [Parasulfuritortus cantonensis]TCJ17128.1 cytochrome C552 [Parasulfuritortus cantonensis]
MDETPGLAREWKKSTHAGKDIDCYDCHKALPGDKDGYLHHKVMIATIVTPKDCAACHEKEVTQQQPSHHAKGGQILASLDNLMGEVIGGLPAVNAGCRQCHGSVVELDAKNMPTAETWPNTGIGRINLDGSKGSCSACHGRHRFSAAQAREPDTCGKCHLGPDHPQKEVYEESKHGILFASFRDEMNMKSKKWVVGVDYTAAPTCATCHMSATQTQGVTHDVGDRISWTLRPPISQKLNMIKLENGDEFDLPASQPLPKVGDAAKGSTVKQIVSWQKRREKMKDVCMACHTDRQVNQHYEQFDNLVDLYNDKFAKPIAAMMEELKKAGYITPAPFDEKIEWTWWEIWHHEGRTTRHGAAMMGPDYTWWHGIYEVAQHTYFLWIPEMKEVVMKKDGNTKFADDLLAKYFKPIDGHDWYFNGLSKEAIDKVRKGFEERYGKGSLK